MGAAPVEPERYSVTFVPPAVQAVAALTASTGLSKADVINRAVQVYAFLERQQEQGSELILRGVDGRDERVHII
jgi:hypothetical protein